ncbi:MAG: hypothetical protein L0Z62_45875 [Gemmataceae bacterium]|nr:hypothetical protein [Gemmataceae bacterium]
MGQTLSPPVESAPSLRADFLTILPAIERHARFAFRHLQRYHDREDAIAETVAVAWAWYVRLARQGRDATAFPTALASFASRHVKSGRHLCGTENTKDALSPNARRHRGFGVEQLPDNRTQGQSPWQEALIDNTQSPVPEQVIFRLDFPAWLLTLTDRDRRIAEQMALGQRTLDLAGDFSVSPARVSQLRREFRQSWQHFHAGSETEGPRETAPAA